MYDAAPALLPCPECYSRRPSPSLQARGRNSKHDRRHQTAVNRQPPRPVPTGYSRSDLANHLTRVHGWSRKRARAGLTEGKPAGRIVQFTTPAKAASPKPTRRKLRRLARDAYRALRPAWWKARAAEVVSIEPPAVAA